MKKLIIPLLFLALGVQAQKTRTQLETQALVIKNATVAGSNTATRIGQMFQDMINSMQNIAPINMTSGTDTYTVLSPTPLISSYIYGQVFLVDFLNTNTGTSTITIGALSSKTIKNADGTNVSAGTLRRLTWIGYDGTNFQVLSSFSSGGGGSSSWGSITGTFSAQTDAYNYINAKVEDLITDGVVLKAPSQNVVFDALALKQDLLVSGTNIKTINSASILGSGNIVIAGAGGDLLSTNNLSDLTSASTARTNLGLGTLATQSGTFSGTSSGTNTGDQTSVAGNAGTATALATPRTIGIITGDGISSGSSFDGSANNTNALTLATVNSNVGSFGSATQSPTYTVNGKGLITAASNTTITPAVGSITGLGTGIATALAVNTGSAGAPVLFNGAGGTPSSLTGTNITGTASGLTAGNVTTNANLTGHVTSTGNASVLGSFSSSNLSTALTDETGTGSAVFGTSPNILYTANTQTSNYTFVLSDAGKIVRMNLTGTANNLTVPPNSSVAYDIGTWLYYEQVGTGITTLVAPSGGSATPPAGGSLVTPARGVICAAFKTGTDVWEVFNSSGLSLGTLGTTTNDNALAGYVGERVTALVAVGSAVSLTTATAANITSISLTAGDWEVSGKINFTETSSTVTARSGGISSTSATVPADGSEGYNGVQSVVTSEINSITLEPKTIKLASTTTIYLVGKATFSAGTCAGFGSIKAIRVR